MNNTSARNKRTDKLTYHKHNMGRRLEAEVLRSHHEMGKGSQSKGKNITKTHQEVKSCKQGYFFFFWLVNFFFLFFFPSGAGDSLSKILRETASFIKAGLSHLVVTRGCYQDPFQLRREPQKRANILAEGWKLKDENLH